MEKKIIFKNCVNQYNIKLINKDVKKEENSLSNTKQLYCVIWIKKDEVKSWVFLSRQNRHNTEKKSSMCLFLPKNHVAERNITRVTQERKRWVREKEQQHHLKGKFSIFFCFHSSFSTFSSLRNFAFSSLFMILIAQTTDCIHFHHQCERIFVSYLNEGKNNYCSWFCYLHSKFKPIIAIKFAIKYRIKMREFVINTQCCCWRREWMTECFIVANCFFLFYLFFRQTQEKNFYSSKVGGEK